MKKFYIIFLLFPTIACTQKKSLTLIDVGANFFSNNSKIYNEPLVGLTYVYKPVKNYSIGVSAEITEFHTYFKFQNGSSGNTSLTTAILADVRYYFNFKKGSVIPIFQTGYNYFHNISGYQVNEPSITTTGGFQYNIGAMYFFKAFKKGYGLTFQLKYDNKTFNNDTKLTSNTETKERTNVGSFIVAIGMRL